MRIEKTFQVASPQQRVWEFITDPERVAPCVPGCEGAERVDDNHYKAVINTRIGPVRTTFNVLIEAVEERPPEFASYVTKGEEGSKASRIKATSELALKPLSPDLTEVSYRSDVTIMGRLGKFGSGMMKKVADGIGESFVTALREQLESEERAAAPEPEAERPARAWLPWALAGALALAALLAWYLT
ncbi:MAG: hypothetical protein D6786_03905 [Gammaproteobacteria bacterium]|nr:MAG: hypothetical protein D6786_03905 [Gammaproteobacteria bacterium]